MSLSPQRAIPAVLAAVLCLFAWPVLRMMVSTYETIPDFSHGYLVPFVSLYALWLTDPAPRIRPWWPGILPLGLGCLAMLVAIWYARALMPGGIGHVTLGASGWVLSLYGIGLCLFGPAAFRHHLFAWLFLLFLIPMPDSLTNQLTFPMRGWISQLTEEILHLLGIRVVREGNILHLAGASLGVESACSGIRSLWMMLAAGVALAFAAGCRKRGWLLVLIASTAMAFFQNLMRVLLTAVLVELKGIHWAQGWRHEAAGWLTFLVALALILGLALRIRKQEPVMGTPGPQPGVYTQGRALSGLIAALLLAGLPLRHMMHQRYVQRDALVQQLEQMRKPLARLPVNIGPFSRVETQVLDQTVRDILMPTDVFFGTYADADGFPIRTIILYWNPQDPNIKMQWVYPHSPDICFPGSGWTLQDPITVSEMLKHPQEWLLARIYSKPPIERLTIYWHNRTLSKQGPHAKPSYAERWEAMRSSLRNPLHNTGIQYSVAIYVDIGNSREHALEVAENFGRALLPVLAEHGISASNVWIDAR